MYHATRWFCALATMAGVALLTRSPFLTLVALALYCALSAPLAHRRPRRLIV